MNCKAVITILEEHSPREFALDWDNTGLLVGSGKKEVRRVYIALDASDEVVEEAAAWEADLLITHHPMIFHGMKQITDDDFIGRRVIKLIQNDISYYAMHTNFDVMGMADLSAALLDLSDSQVLDVTAVCDGQKEGIGRCGMLSEPMTLADCAQFVREAFELQQVKIFGEPQTMVRAAAISPGSGKSEIKNALSAGAQVLITGDIDHHDGIDAVAQGLNIIDAGHYGLEHIFVNYLKKYLDNRCEGLEIRTQNLAFPFWVM